MRKYLRVAWGCVSLGHIRNNTVRQGLRVPPVTEIATLYKDGRTMSAHYTTGSVKLEANGKEKC